MAIPPARLFAIAAALCWALVPALLAYARPMPPLQALALALLFAFLAGRMLDFMKGVCAVRPFANPVTWLGLTALVAWIAHGMLETTLWSGGPRVWLAVAAMGLGPVLLTTLAWRRERQAWVPALAALAALLGGRLL